MQYNYHVSSHPPFCVYILISLLHGVPHVAYYLPLCRFFLFFSSVSVLGLVARMVAKC